MFPWDHFACLGIPHRSKQLFALGN